MTELILCQRVRSKWRLVTRLLGLPLSAGHSSETIVCESGSERLSPGSSLFFFSLLSEPLDVDVGDPPAFELAEDGPLVAVGADADQLIEALGDARQEWRRPGTRPTERTHPRAGRPSPG